VKRGTELLLIAAAFLAGLAVAAMIEAYEGDKQAAAWLEDGEHAGSGAARRRHDYTR